jgi:hypothetical protein
MRQSEVDQRKQIWRTIQTEAPEIADFLNEVNVAFGKPDAVLVTIKDKPMLDKGVLLPAKPDKYFKGSR